MLTWAADGVVFLVSPKLDCVASTANECCVGPDGKSFKRGNIVFRDLALPLKKKEEKKSAIV